MEQRFESISLDLDEEISAHFRTDCAGKDGCSCKPSVRTGRSSSGAVMTNSRSKQWSSAWSALNIVHLLKVRTHLNCCDVVHCCSNTERGKIAVLTFKAWRFDYLALETTTVVLTTTLAEPTTSPNGQASTCFMAFVTMVSTFLCSRNNCASVTCVTLRPGSCRMLTL